MLDLLEVLLAHAMRRDRVYLFAHSAQELQEVEWLHYGRYLHERLKGKPTQYITRRQEFSWLANIPLALIFGVGAALAAGGAIAGTLAPQILDTSNRSLAGDPLQDGVPGGTADDDGHLPTGGDPLLGEHRGDVTDGAGTDVDDQRGGDGAG